MKRHIPNFITLLNVFCGCIACVFAVNNQLEIAAIFVFLGIFFDFFDGLAARLLDVRSELGVQLDSLADMITSGLVPGIVMYQLLRMAETGGWNITASTSSMEVSIIPFFGFLITMASAYRLAKFNIDENQQDSFIGLPTPANALLIISLPLIMIFHSNEFLNDIILNEWFLLGLTLLSAYLLNSNIELFALKFKKWGFKENALRYIFIIISIVLLVTMKYIAVPLIIIFYILSSIVANMQSKNAN
ncbi:CDP-alcohol phosphatidyltransferase family protein [Aurantibacter crassamenti]|uniref:CDP-alcohol phosphatidyltransferase family protein n=1 Tax=Aurantibacter crassamenti TaxID=1837375 RepID=UPI001939E9BD|nr:CDP-alcohol phosphatidyltransferase family protein [Aurantibacter crassamenti]MBM1106484.1 CDP-alcohol phosphatidyltransferase family protein [Aurantibacter crassamenti]